MCRATGVDEPYRELDRVCLTRELPIRAYTPLNTARTLWASLVWKHFAERFRTLGVMSGAGGHKP